MLLAAGKVHGSLARAGKVRGQTPKVAKADKKKNPKGRAAQRIKYNRRFVNVGEHLPRPLHRGMAAALPRRAAHGDGNAADCADPSPSRPSTVRFPLRGIATG